MNSFEESLKQIPSAQLENFLREQGLLHVAGTDEVGRGCLAGPVVAAAVILPASHSIDGIQDSKLLTPAQRELLHNQILSQAVASSVAFVEVEVIDRINIFHASLQAMVQALKQLNPAPDFLLVDGKFPIPHLIPQKPVIKGDQHCLSIGAASIIAKVSRDRHMAHLEKEYPHFHFSSHKGYPTKQHRDEIKRFGILPIHRKSFRLLKD